MSPYFHTLLPKPLFSFDFYLRKGIIKAKIKTKSPDFSRLY